MLKFHQSLRANSTYRTVSGRLAVLILLLSMSVNWCLGNEPASAQVSENSVVMLEDDFQSYRSGTWLGEVGAHLEYHYIHEIAPRGPWQVSTFHTDVRSQTGWKVIDDQGVKTLAQTYRNHVKYTHPLVDAGDPLWANYTVEVQFTPTLDHMRSGVIVRARHDRCYYFFGVEQSRLVLRKVQHESALHVPHEPILAEAPFEFKPNTLLTAKITVSGNQLRGEIVGGPTITAQDDTFTHGKIGLLADAPTRYHYVKVTMNPADAEATQNHIAERDQTELDLQNANPKPKLWKKISTLKFGAGRNLRFGDLNGDGKPDILIGQVLHHGDKDRNSELSCLTAIDLEGKTLWQIGRPDPWKVMLTNDVAFQIHDLDGDGQADVVYTKNQELIVADGKTGKTKFKVPTPDAYSGSDPLFPKVLGDALFFCDLRGTGRAADLLIKDRYKSFWTFDDKLQPLFSGRCNTGHYPYALDVTGEGHDDLFVGYSRYDHSGKKVFSLDKQITQHADTIGVARLNEQLDDKPTVVCAASDEGVYFADIEGNIIHHHLVGHAQNCTIANFRDDLPGLETLTINFWGNQGVTHLFDSRGQVNWEAEPCQHASLLSPVNWTGNSEEFFMLSGNVEEGGLFDGLCRRVVRMPNDGHPDLACTALDLTGDCRDELVVWNQHEIWIYTQDDNPLSGKIYHPKRNPTYNESNYRANISLPGWKE